MRRLVNEGAAIVKRLRADGVQRVVLVGPCPEWTPNLYRVMVKDFAPPRPARLKTHLIDEVMKTDRVLRDRYGASPALTYASVIGALCNEEGCLTYLDDDDREGLTTFDFGHLTLVASAFVGRQVLMPAFGTALQPGDR